MTRCWCKLLLNLLVLFSLSVPAFAADTAKESAYDRVMRTHTLRCGYILYPPYMDKDLKSGQLKGPSHDVVEETGKALNLSIQWVEEVPVGQDVATLETGKVDSICGITGTYDPNMFPLIDFSQPYLYVRNMIYARAGDARFSKPVGPGDLNQPDLTFGGIEGDSTALYAKLLFPKAKVSELPQLSDTAQIFMEIDASKVDLAIVEPGVAARALASNPARYKPLRFTGHLPAYGAAFSFPKGEEKLISTINQTIDYLNVNGVIDDVLDRYDPQKTLFIRPAKPYAE